MKLKGLKDVLKEKKIDLALFLNLSLEKRDPNISYFTQMDLEFACLAIPKKDRAFLITSYFEKERAKRYGRIKNAIAKKRGKLFEQVKERCKRVKTIGINKDMVTLNEYKTLRKNFKKARFVDISKELRSLRATKTEEEVGIIRESAKIASSILEKAIKSIKKLKTELKVKEFLEIETKKNGCELSFPVIVATGANASLPHYSPQDVKLKKGFCVIDFGVKYKGYCSDITRTIYLGKPSKKEAEIYNFLLAVQKDAIKNIKLGGKCSDLFYLVKKNLKGYSKYFTHGLGHGIGAEIHENPNLMPMSREKFKEGMAFTVEPGIYIDNKFGIRIEDDVLIKKKGIEVLSKVKKELIAIK